MLKMERVEGGASATHWDQGIDQTFDKISGKRCLSKLHLLEVFGEGQERDATRGTAKFVSRVLINCRNSS